jgi:hypothetical protein
LNNFLLTSSWNLNVVYKFSCVVGVICLFMVFINIWFIKELILYVKEIISEDSKITKVKTILVALFMLLIAIVSFILIFLAIRCFTI